MLPIGKKAVDYFRSHNVPILARDYAEAEDMSLGDCFTVAKSLCKAYLAGEFQEIHVVYTNFVSVLSQTPAALRLLPLINGAKRGGLTVTPPLSPRPPSLPGWRLQGKAGAGGLLA